VEIAPCVGRTLTLHTRELTHDGPGIHDVSRALQDGYSTGIGLGLGLPGVRRLVDDFDVVSVVGKGTTVTARKWVL